MKIVQTTLLSLAALSKLTLAQLGNITHANGTFGCPDIQILAVCCASFTNNTNLVTTGVGCIWAQGDAGNNFCTPGIQAHQGACCQTYAAGFKGTTMTALRCTKV